MEAADFVELSPSKLLVITRTKPEFFIINLLDQARNRVEHIEGGGYGNIGLTLTLLPHYDPKDYPFVLVKEDTCISLFNPMLNHFEKICELKPS